MLKKIKPYIFPVGATIILMLALFGFSQLNNPVSNVIDEKILGGGNDPYVIQAMNRTSTTTGSFCATCPVLVLERDPDRQYAVIQNVSDTDIYLVATSTSLTVDGLGGITATSTITSLDGIKLEQAGTVGDTYVIGVDNLIIDNIWATSTLGSKQINVTYK